MEQGAGGREWGRFASSGGSAGVARDPAISAFPNLPPLISGCSGREPAPTGSETDEVQFRVRRWLP